MLLSSFFFDFLALPLARFLDGILSQITISLGVGLEALCTAVVCSTSLVWLVNVSLSDGWQRLQSLTRLRAGDIVQTPCRYIVRQSRSLCRDYVSQDCAVILLWREAFLSLCLPLNHLFTLAMKKLLSLTTNSN